MSIETECPKCGKGYRVKDEMAGKRFRCKQCQAAVSIPEPPTDADADSGDQWDQDFLGGLDSAVKSERRTSPAPGPPPIAGRKSKPSAASRKKRTSKSGGGEGAATALKIIGGILGGGVGLVVGYLVVRALLSAAGGGGGAAWQSFTPPEGGYRVEMPGQAKSRFVPGSAPGAKTYYGETRKFACAVTQEPFPPEAEGVGHEQLLQLVADNFSMVRPGSKVFGRKPLTFGEHAAMELQISLQSQGSTLTNTSRIVIADQRVYSIEYVDAGSGSAADRERFFNSFKLLDASGQPQPDSWGTSGAAAASTDAAMIRSGEASDAVAAARSPTTRRLVQPVQRAATATAVEEVSKPACVGMAGSAAQRMALSSPVRAFPLVRAGHPGSEVLKLSRDSTRAFSRVGTADTAVARRIQRAANLHTA